ncbi:UBIQUITIN-40S ribosomal protein S31 [Anaeramoeba flamelloides]|uniref:UBIQUITIN-40S ribosomal protein S31 n=1 Tax=Anaeramoeba flamelloides TaxID=1746091 RepID=A0AAV8A0X1_9EUKA|nr:UBIQUITIN-40S ribosomal protein S31 [Anaeramoeba flamelloides]KAJ6251913.1 UBIQUITIN-40S ribosomal protein S31 [Anaeramoeba flamelloides]
MKIYIITERARTITLEVAESTEIMHIKLQIMINEGTPIELQKIVFNEEELEENRTLKSYSVVNESTLYLFRLERQVGEADMTDEQKIFETYENL